MPRKPRPGPLSRAERIARSAARASSRDVPGLAPLTVSRAQACSMLGIDLQTLDALISSRTLKASKLGRRVLISMAALQEMLDANPAA